MRTWIKYVSFLVIAVLYLAVQTHLPCYAGVRVEAKEDLCAGQDTLALDAVVLTCERAKLSQNKIGQVLAIPQIERALGTSLTSLLEQVSGVSSINTGTIVSKPVIQGMYGNRILIINNGIKQTGQQWSVEHAPEIDMNGHTNIQVIKGADAIKYGADALGGTIIMDQSELPFYSDRMKSTLSTLYGTNGRRYIVTGMAEGPLKLLKSQSLAWRVQGTFVNSGDRSTANYLLNNTGVREYDFSTTIGYNSGRFKTSLFYSCFKNKAGIMLTAKMGNEDILKERIELGRPVYVEPFTRKIVFPSEKVLHQILMAKAQYSFENYGLLQLHSSIQKDNRKEYQVRRLGRGVPTVSTFLTSYENQFAWKFDKGCFHSETGVQYRFTDNYNQNGTGVTTIIPNYTESELGVFAIGKYHHNKFGLEAGLRYDNKEVRASGYDWTGYMYGGTTKFSNMSYNLGTHFHPTRNITIKSNLGATWRAPHVYELYSNGNELGAGVFVRGDSTMVAETSIKWITSAIFQNKWINLSLDGFLQRIDGYIYDEPIKENIVVLSGAYPIFQYKQTPAFFRGVDFDLHLRPSSRWDYHMIASWIRANERKIKRFLPFIPSFHLSHDLSLKSETKPKDISRTQSKLFGNRRVENMIFEMNLSHKYVAKQKRFDPTADLIAFTPPAYNLFGLELALEVKMSKLKHRDVKNSSAQSQKRQISSTQMIRFFIASENLFNKEYKEYTNRSRYYAHDMGRDIRFGLTLKF